MKKTTKAMLLSLLVFPGTGQLVFRRWLRGALFIVPVLVLMWMYIVKSIEQAAVVMDLVISGDLAPDVLSIYKALREGPQADGLVWLAVSAYGILLLWAFAAIDVYLLARRFRSSNGD